jgi:hypothetical protein
MLSDPFFAEKKYRKKAARNPCLLEAFRQELPHDFGKFLD